MKREEGNLARGSSLCATRGDCVRPLAVVLTLEHRSALHHESIVTSECHRLIDLVVELDGGHSSTDGCSWVCTRLYTYKYQLFISFTKLSADIFV